MTYTTICRWSLTWLVIHSVVFGPGDVARLSAAVIFGNRDLARGSRWDAASRHIGDDERSLDGGLRFSLQGGSYADFRDRLTWAGAPPSVDAFQTAIRQAFDAWTVIDPASHLGTDLRFVEDLATTVVGPPPGTRVDVRGAEIDLLTTSDGVLWNTGNARLQGETFFDTSPLTTVTLTSGSDNYPGYAIGGVDIKLNSNPQARWDLTAFQTVLTHEIGHAIGLGDVDTSDNFGRFIDDNYDGTTSATARATLNNPWSALVDPFDPSASPLGIWEVANANPGLDTPGVDIVMESAIPSVFFGVAHPLQNDDFGGRQFLYPAPAPGVMLGDMNYDGKTDSGDVEVFAEAFSRPAAYTAQFGAPPASRGDMDADGDFDFDDIDGFVTVVVQGTTRGPAIHVAEPSTAMLLALFVAVLLLRGPSTGASP